jgi:hypothetical protein
MSIHPKLVGNAVPAVPPLTQAWGADTRGATWLHGCVPNITPHRRGDNPLLGWVEGALKCCATHNKHLDDKNENSCGTQESVGGRTQHGCG